MSAVRPRRRTRTARELAEELDVTPRTIRKYAAEPRADYEQRAKHRRRTVVTLRLQGLSYKQIAEQTGDSASTVAHLLHAARRHGEMPDIDGRTRQGRATIQGSP
ncbi:HTH domain-containing protein [Pseudonocardia sp. EV170527-09]|uniref:sigma factor-like helix-turn-helix DNA-binding protein n=1 Tax=Pseudonocardia sp. EV170527-09 TaxID=2603411 RepID=UPI0011F20558|nr:HTH domain-containing protein [Pseudonocardia sp. EV170527-09]